MTERVMIVDDSEDIRALLRRILHSSGYEVFAVDSGKKVFEEIPRIQPDLLLLDIMMPEMDGYEVCERLKKEPGFSEIPVIFLSAKSDIADKIKGLETGGVDYITKPFDKGEVLARVENQLKIRRLTKELIRANNELTEKQRRLDDDLKAAAGIQQSLLPNKLPDIKNMHIAWKFMPSQSIGGDIFNIFRLDESRIGIYMIDVSGHGVPSALVTVSVSQALNPYIGSITKRTIPAPPGYEITTPKEILYALDREYPIERFDKYFTIVYIIINTRTGETVYSNAAHPNPLLLRADGTIEYLTKGGSIIGMGGLPFEEGQFYLQLGDKLLLYTDGVIEYQNNDGETFGEERLYLLLNQYKKDKIDTLLDGIMISMNDFGKGKEFQDDITLVALEYKGAEE